MVSDFGAIDNWDEKLRREKPDGEEERMPLVELEKLWLISRPILFVGMLDEVNVKDSEPYCQEPR